MSDAIASLFAPFSHGALNLRNRIVMSPMTRYFAPGGTLSAAVAPYYERRAIGEVGLIISEGAFIDRAAARNFENIPAFHGDALDGWSEVLDKVHAGGAAMAPQLWHVGGMPDYNFPGSPYAAGLESPSGLIGPDLPSGRVMSEEDIADVAAAFARGAADARRLGFDTVELHGAHGYLFDQFFWAATNRRSDRYGGADLGERTRFAVEVLRQVRAAVGPDFPIIFRLSQWKLGFYDEQMAASPAELEAWLRPLVDAGVDIFDCSQRRIWDAEYEGSPLNLAGWVKKLSSQPTITVGSVGLSTELREDFEPGSVSAPSLESINRVAERLDRGEFDLVAVGRALIADPAWARKVRERRFDELASYSVELISGGALV